MNLTPFQEDALKEIIHIGVGRAASVLNQMVESPVRLTVPVLKSLRSLYDSELGEFGDDILSSVRITFKGSMVGAAMLVFPAASAMKLVSVLTAEDTGSPDLDSMRMEALNEAGSILLNGVVGSIANIGEMHLDYTFPNYMEDSIKGLARDIVEQFFKEESGDEYPVIMGKATFSVDEHLIDGTILLVFSADSVKSLIRVVDNTTG